MQVRSNVALHLEAVKHTEGRQPSISDVLLYPSPPLSPLPRIFLNPRWVRGGRQLTTALENEALEHDPLLAAEGGGADSPGRHCRFNRK